MAKAYHEQSLTEMREEHGKYFEAVQQHPRALVGDTVPSLIEGKPDIVLKDVAEVEAWQGHLKQILVDELRGKTTKALEENSDYLNTLHASIEIFQNNTDLIPGTKDFDLELANRFSDMAQPYEIRVDEKLHGYSIPVQAIIDKIRAGLVKERAGAPETKGKDDKAGEAAASGKTPAVEEQPQTGITSKAGGGGEAENFDTLFGTLGFDSAPRF